MAKKPLLRRSPPSSAELFRPETNPTAAPTLYHDWRRPRRDGSGQRGAFEVGAKSIGLNIDLPHEQEPNPYIRPSSGFQFHYFAMRKFHFVLPRRRAGGLPRRLGTLDELFDTLCLRPNRRMQRFPVILYSRKYWIDHQLHQLADECVIDDEDLKLVSYAETPEEAWTDHRQIHGSRREISRSAKAQIVIKFETRRHNEHDENTRKINPMFPPVVFVESLW